jgi:MGT family glycosyltransferase
MARAVFFSFPAYGHITPALAVIRELTGRGEEVHVFATERSRDAVADAGASLHVYPAPYERFDPRPATSGLFSDMPRLLGLAEEILPSLVEALDTLAPDYMLLDTKSIWGRLAAAALDLPAATMSVVFAIRPGVVSPCELVRMLYASAPEAGMVAGLKGFSAYAAIAQRLARRYRARVPDLIEFLGNPQPLNIIFTSRVLQPNEQAFGSEYVFVGRAVAPNRDGAVDFPFEQLTQPFIYVSLGTTFNDAPGFYAACFEAFADAPWQVVLAAGEAAGSLSPGPVNFIVRRFVPQLRLLESARAFVTHGGMNGVNEGLAEGVPLIVVPQRGDQHLVAARVVDHGAGIRIGPGEVTPTRLREAVDAVIEQPSYRRAAEAIGRTLVDAGGATRAAGEILAWSRRLQG